MAIPESVVLPSAGATPATSSHSRHGSIGVLGATALVAGGMIGSGVYLLPASLGAVGSISILGWIAATAAALALAGMFAWLGKAAPGAKGLPDYVDAGLGPFFGVQTAAVYWASIWIGSVALAAAVAGAVGFLVPELGGPGARLLIIQGSIWLSVAVAWAGPRAVSHAEGLTLALGLLPVLVAATVGWFVFHPATFIGSWNPQGLGVVSAVRGSAVTAFFAFLGIECAAAAAGVVRDPVRNVPRATLIGVAAVAAIYISACAVLMGILPATSLARSPAPFAEAGKATLGVGLAAFIGVCAGLRALGCLMGWTLVASETSRTGADTGVFPRLFRTRAGERVSTTNLIAIGVLMSLVALATGSPTLGRQFGVLADISVLLALYTYVLVGCSLMRLAGSLGPGHAAAARLTTLVAVGCCVALIASGDPHELAFCLLPIAGAGLLYLWLRRR